jgi:hypothetical protein
MKRKVAKEEGKREERMKGMEREGEGIPKGEAKIFALASFMS